MNMEYSNADFLKETGLNNVDLTLIREEFKLSYAKRKNWNPKQLTVEQLNEIQNQKEWNNPMLLS